MIIFYYIRLIKDPTVLPATDVFVYILLQLKPYSCDCLPYIHILM